MCFYPCLQVCSWGEQSVPTAVPDFCWDRAGDQEGEVTSTVRFQRPETAQQGRDEEHMVWWEEVTVAPKSKKYNEKQTFCGVPTLGMPCQRAGTGKSRAVCAKAVCPAYQRELEELFITMFTDYNQELLDIWIPPTICTVLVALMALWELFS